MPSSKAKSFLICLHAALLLLCGCSVIRPAPLPSAIPIAEEPTPSAAAAPTAAPESDTHRIDGTTTIVNEKRSTAFSGQSILYIAAGGDLLASEWLLDLSAGSADSMDSTSEPAAIKTESAGKARFSACTLASSVDMLPLLYCLGAAELSDTTAVHTGSDAAILSAADGGTISVSRCDLLANGVQGSCVTAKHGGRIDCTDGTRLSAAAEESLSIRLSDGGTVTVTDGEVFGDIALSGYGNTLRCTNTRLQGNLRFDTAEDEIDLCLQSGSRFIGTTDGDGAIGVCVSLDTTSSWTLTETAYVAVLHDADPTLSNIDSCGYSIYYNAESEENLWLLGKTHALNGGGYLIPLI